MRTVLVGGRVCSNASVRSSAPSEQMLGASGHLVCSGECFAERSRRALVFGWASVKGMEVLASPSPVILWLARAEAETGDSSSKSASRVCRCRGDDGSVPALRGRSDEAPVDARLRADAMPMAPPVECLASARGSRWVRRFGAGPAFESDFGRDRAKGAALRGLERRSRRAGPKGEREEARWDVALCLVQGTASHRCRTSGIGARRLIGRDSSPPAVARGSCTRTGSSVLRRGRSRRTGFGRFDAARVAMWSGSLFGVLRLQSGYGRSRTELQGRGEGPWFAASLRSVHAEEKGDWLLR